MATVDAIFCSDIHLSHVAPKCRQEKGTAWYGVMASHLAELSAMEPWDVPIFIAGDIFHRWNSPPELINFAIRNMPKCYAIPGQHDLPYHDYKEVKKSAYWTLVEAGVITDIPAGVSIRKPNPNGRDMDVTAFPWEHPLAPHVPTISLKDGYHKIALVHAYVWRKGHEYMHAPVTRHVDQLKQNLTGYTHAFFGDNHSAFAHGTRDSDTQIINCGGFMRRTASELGYRPSVWLLKSDGSVERRYLESANHDKFNTSTVSKTPDELDVSDFVEMLQNVDTHSLDFKDVLLRWIKDPQHRINKLCKQLLYTMLEELQP